MKNLKVAVPSEGNGGLDSQRSGHFGHCAVFTIIDIKDGQIADVAVLPNQEHSQGGCLVPVNMLAAQHVNALIAGGMGLRPLMGFNEAGIEVYYDATHPGVREAVNELMAGNLEKMTENRACGGDGHHH